MAMAKGIEVTVSVEAALNNAMHDVAMKLYTEHGLRIQHVSFDWMSTPTVDKPGYFLKDVTVTSSGSGKL